MYSGASRLWCALVIVVPMLAGCISNTPVDLAFSSVQVVDYHDQLQLPPSTERAALVASPAQRVLMGLSSDLATKGHSGERSHDVLLRAQFTSGVDLPKFIEENGYTLSNTAYLCDRPKDRVLLSFPSVYLAEVGSRQDELFQESRDNKATAITYYVFLAVARDKIVPSFPQVEAFDLRRNPENVCFYLSGGSEWTGYRSNTVVVPAEAIAAALREVTPGP